MISPERKLKQEGGIISVSKGTKTHGRPWVCWVSSSDPSVGRVALARWLDCTPVSPCESRVMSLTLGGCGEAYILKCVQWLAQPGCSPMINSCTCTHTHVVRSGMFMVVWPYAPLVF